MIGLLKGKIQHTNIQNVVILMVQDVGYEMMCSDNVLTLSTQDQITFYTHLQWREDGPVLYGFQNTTERDLFRILLKISGIGGKTALAILSQFSAQDLYQITSSQNIAALTQVSGIGKKSAERILLELKSHQKSIMIMDNVNPTSKKDLTSDEKDVYQSASQGLLGLGFGEKEIYNLLKSIDLKNKTIEVIIQEALKNA